MYIHPHFYTVRYGSVPVFIKFISGFNTVKSLTFYKFQNQSCFPHPRTDRPLMQREGSARRRTQGEGGPEKYNVPGLQPIVSPGADFVHAEFL